MDFTAFNARMIADENIKRLEVGTIPLGYEFSLRYPTYRGAYVCNLEELNVFVDGREIARDNMRFGINGKWFLMSQISELSTEYWFTGTTAKLRILDECGISDGEHKIKVHMKHKIPYTGYFGNYLKVDSDCERILRAEKGEMA